jgi:superfamily II DNA or RNA helicase
MPNKTSDNIDDKLLVYQKNHVKNLISIIKINSVVLDASDTGTGKTYTAIATCAYLKLKPLIVCPKSVISNWARVCKIFNVKPFFISNYETLRMGKYYINKQRTQCPYIKYIELDGDEDTSPKFKYEWEIEENMIFIFDEVHKCTEFSTHNGQLLYSAKKINKPMMLLSATIADHPEKFKLFFYILNFIDPNEVAKKNIEYHQYINIMLNWIMRDIKPMERIYHMLYPQRASRMRIDVLGPLFPDTQISAVPYTMGHKREDEIEKQYKIISTELDELKSKGKKDRGNILVKVLRAHQKIELLKIPTFVDLAHDLIYSGHSVVIFVNFTQTLQTLADMLHTTCLIYGKQNIETREKNIKLFQENKSKIIICNIKAGSTGISLHDLEGNHPRASLISPTWSSIELVQALGRIWRAGGKSKSLQRIIYAANTVEEKIADKLQEKLNNINSINNGDLDLTNITFEKERLKM